MTILLTPDKMFIDESAYDAARENPDKRGTYLYDLPTDWQKQKVLGARLAGIKVFEWVIDPAALMNAKRASDAGMIRILYDYFHPSWNAIDQAQKFIAVLKQIGLKWTGDPKTSDKICMDWENLDGMAAIPAMKAAASFFYEVNKVFPDFEFIIYTGGWFWNPLVQAGANSSWVSKTFLWLAEYPWDPYPGEKNPPPVFTVDQVNKMAMVCLNDSLQPKPLAIPLVGWKKASYWQITGHADAKQVPGLPGTTAAADVSVCLVEIPAPVMEPGPHRHRTANTAHPCHCARRNNPLHTRPACFLPRGGSQVAWLVDHGHAD